MGTWTSPYTSIEIYLVSDASSNNALPTLGYSATFSGVRTIYGTSNLYVLPNSWNMVALTFTSSTLAFYVNGVLQGTPAAGGSSTDFGTHGPWVVGGNTELTTENFEGKIDEVTVQSTALSQYQIQSLWLTSGRADRTFTYDTTNGSTHGVRRGSPVVNYGIQIPALTWSAGKSGAGIRVSFSRALRSLAATTVAGNYVVTGPSSIVVNSVTFTPGDPFVVLNITGSFMPGSYTLTIAALTAQALADDTFNDITPASFDGMTVQGGGAGFNPGFN
jgi:hypothetical protein